MAQSRSRHQQLFILYLVEYHYVYSFYAFTVRIHCVYSLYAFTVCIDCVFIVQNHFGCWSQCIRQCIRIFPFGSRF